MDLFLNAKSIRLVTFKDRYLVAEEDQVTITQAQDGSTDNAIWIVELVEGRDSIRLKSCYGTYLTASSTPLLPGFTGKKVIQSWPCQPDPSTEWEPLRDGMQVRLKSLWGDFLRPHSSLPPWKSSVTHELPHLSKTREKLLWAIEVVEKCPDRQRPRVGLAFSRSRSMSASQKQSENLRRVLLDDQRDHRFLINMRCCWHTKACTTVSG